MIGFAAGCAVGLVVGKMFFGSHRADRLKDDLFEAGRRYEREKTRGGYEGPKESRPPTPEQIPRPRRRWTDEGLRDPEGI